MNVEIDGVILHLAHPDELSVRWVGQEEIMRQQAHETTRLPADLDYRSVRGLSHEVQQKLNQHRPETLGQAARISGITPAAISLLLVHLKRGFRATQKTA